MKKMNSLLASLSAVCLMTGAAMAADDAVVETMVETYAHPTMFGTVAQENVTATGEYVTGGKIVKATNSLGIKNKKNVAVSSWAKDVLSTIQDNTTDRNWNVKMPILRSELAVMLVEGLGLNQTAASKYTDIQDGYWAKQWIEKALASSVMIGYPDNTFRPDQPVTKAEVFATLATLMEVPADAAAAPTFNGSAVKYIPNWAVPATNEVIASDVLADTPCPNKVINDEYLTKEQVAYLVGTFRSMLSQSKTTASGVLTSAYTPVAIKIKMLQRLSAKTSNIGDKFTAQTTEAVVLNGQSFPAGSKVKGEVIDVARPGVKNQGYMRIKFTEIVNGDCKLAFPNTLSEAEAAKIKNPNFVARILGAPFSAAARVVGISGRTAGAGFDVAGNGLEQFGDEISDTFVNTFTLHPGSGVKSFGNSIITVGKGVFDLVKLAVSGVFGVVYEVADEVVYLIVPSVSNEASINANEELVIVY